MSLDGIWQRLLQTKTLSFNATSSLATGWNGAGNGTVVVSVDETGKMLFTETGHWTNAKSETFQFNNVYRWSRPQQTATLRLEHVRLGTEQPVYLFDLAIVSKNRLFSVEPHSCGEDSYSAIMLTTEFNLRVNWSVTGPDKEETIGYVYS